MKWEIIREVINAIASAILAILNGIKNNKKEQT